VGISNRRRVNAPKTRKKLQSGKVRQRYYHDPAKPVPTIHGGGVTTPRFVGRRQSMISPEVPPRADATGAIEKFHFRERRRRVGGRRRQLSTDRGSRSAADWRSQTEQAENFAESDQLLQSFIHQKMVETEIQQS